MKLDKSTLPTRGPVRLTDPMSLERLPLAITINLFRFTIPGGKFASWLSQSHGLLVVVALDPEGVVGWSAAHLGEHTVGVFVASRHRRQGIGTRLMDALCSELRERWPEIEWSSSTAPGSVGRKFMAAHDRRVSHAP